jgi:hypothetical protein
MRRDIAQEVEDLLIESEYNAQAKLPGAQDLTQASRQLQPIDRRFLLYG